MSDCNLNSSGIWVNLDRTLKAANYALQVLKQKANSQTQGNIERAYKEWRNSGFIYWLTKRPRPEWDDLLFCGGRDTASTPAQRTAMQCWFDSLPVWSESWNSPEQAGLVAGIGERGARLEKIISALYGVDREVTSVFLSLEDLYTIGESLG